MTEFVREHVPQEQMIRPEDVSEAVRFVLRTSPYCVVPEIVFQRPSEVALSPDVESSVGPTRSQLPVTPTTRTPHHKDTVASLRARLARLEREAAARQRQLERYAADLREIFKQERNRAQELRRSYKATVLALANAVEARDAYTGRHAERVAAYGLRIAHAAGVDVDPQVEFGFLLHDVGKVAVPDAILFKPGPLTDEERALMVRHPEIGSEILRHIDFLDEAKVVVLPPPRALGRRRLPRRAQRARRSPCRRACSRVADTLDAITTDRPYRPACDLGGGARAVIRAAAGTQFDPAIVTAYETLPDEAFARIRDGVA